MTAFADGHVNGAGSPSFNCVNVELHLAGWARPCAVRAVGLTAPQLKRAGVRNPAKRGSAGGDWLPVDQCRGKTPQGNAKHRGTPATYEHMKPDAKLVIGKHELMQ